MSQPILLHCLIQRKHRYVILRKTQEDYLQRKIIFKLANPNSLYLITFKKMVMSKETIITSNLMIKQEMIFTIQ